MRRDQDTHDAVIIEMMYVLATAVVTLIGFLIVVLLTGWVLDLNSTAWHHAGVAVGAFAALVVLARAVLVLSQHPTQHVLD